MAKTSTKEKPRSSLLRHPLVIVLVVAVIAIGFYYAASPYQNCIRAKTKDLQKFNIWISDEAAYNKAVERCKGSGW